MSKTEMMALNPARRDRYVHDLVWQAVTDEKAMTIKMIAGLTDLTRPTILKHLQGLVSEQRVIAEEQRLGDVRIMTFRRAGQIKKSGLKGEFKGKRDYAFLTIDSGDNRSVIIQQRERDELGNDRVQGAIAVDFEDMKSFLKELFTFGNRATQS